MSKNLQSINDYRVDFRPKYYAVAKINCPVIGEVVFNGKGFNHIFYKSGRKDRSINDIKTRIRIFDHAVELLAKSQYYSNYEKDIKASKPIEYWEFFGVIKNKRIKVVVRREGNGNIHFFSVIPAWEKKRFQ